jgi:hypothetical protein
MLISFNFYLLRISPQIPGSIPRISVGYRHEVEVDLNGMIKLVDLAHYEKTVHPATWKVFNSIANEIKNRNIRASFFNATPQGGGGKYLSIDNDNFISIK